MSEYKSAVKKGLKKAYGSVTGWNREMKSDLSIARRSIGSGSYEVALKFLDDAEYDAKKAGRTEKISEDVLNLRGEAYRGEILKRLDSISCSRDFKEEAGKIRKYVKKLSELSSAPESEKEQYSSAIISRLNHAGVLFEKNSDPFVHAGGSYGTAGRVQLRLAEEYAKELGKKTPKKLSDLNKDII